MYANSLRFTLQWKRIYAVVQVAVLITAISDVS